MKTSIGSILFFAILLSASAKADVLFAPIWRRVYNENNCVYRYNSFDDSAALRVRFKVDDKGHSYNSEYGWALVPSCEGFFFRGLNGNVFFIERNRISEKEKDSSWRERFNAEPMAIPYARVGFDAKNEFVFWLGDDGDTTSPTPVISYNILTTWDVRNRKIVANRVPIGIGHDVMSDAVFIPQQKQILIVSMSETTHYPSVALFNYDGTKVRELTNITQYIRENIVGGGWEFRISLGYDNESGLYHLVTGDQNFLVPEPRRNRLYIFDIEADKVIKTQDGV